MVPPPHAWGTQPGAASAPRFRSMLPRFRLPVQSGPPPTGPRTVLLLSCARRAAIITHHAASACPAWLVGSGFRHRRLRGPRANLPCYRTTRDMDKELDDNPQQLLQQLRIEHRNLDQIISGLSGDASTDQLRLRRLKKRKLQLKDFIARLESRMIPDLDA